MVLPNATLVLLVDQEPLVLSWDDPELTNTVLQALHSLLPQRSIP